MVDFNSPSHSRNVVRIKLSCLCLVCFLSVRFSHAQIRPDFVLADSAIGAHIKIDMEGRLHTVWTKFDGWPVYYGLFDSLGQELQLPIRVSERSSAFIPRLAVTQDHTIAVWVRRVIYNTHIVGQLLPLSGDTTLRNIKFNDSYGNALRGSPDVTFLNDTTFMVIGTGDGPLTYPYKGVYGQIAIIIADSLQLVGSNLLLGDYLGEAYYPGFSRVASNYDSPNVVVAWIDDRLGSPQIFGRLFSKDGTPLDSSFLISEDSDFTYGWNPSVVMYSDGSFTVAYSAETGDTVWNVYNRRFFQDGTPVGPSVKINEYLVEYASTVAISKDSDEKGVIVWEGKDSETSQYIIMAQRFSQDGTLVGNNFTVSTFPETKDHWYPTVDIHNGKIYTAWSGKLSPTTWANIIDFYDPRLNTYDDPPDLPLSVRLYPNYPNPFNAMTNIRYEVPRSSHVQLAIYDIMGRQIILLVDKQVKAGSHEVIWNGKDKKGTDVASGIYLLRSIVEEYTHVYKMVLIR